MDTSTLFKRLVIGKMAIYILWLALPWVEERYMTEDVYDALSWNGVEAELILPRSLLWLFTFLDIMASIGLYGYLHSARSLFLALIVLSLILSLFGGVRVSTAPSMLLGGLLALGDGALLVLAFTPPLRERFRRRQSTAWPESGE